MINRKQKGNRNQLKAIKYWESKGYKVGKVEQNNKYSVVKDLFGIFDLIAAKKKDFYYIQITTNKNHPHQQYKDFSIEHDSENRHFIQMVYYDRKGFKIHHYKKGLKKTIDERKSKK